MLNNNDKKLLRELIKQEIKKFEEKESTILIPQVQFLSAEEKYDEYLKKLLKKLE